MIGNDFVMILGKVFLILLMAFVLALLTAIPVMLVWNSLMVEKFHMPGLKLLEAWQLAFLCACLFKSSSATSTSKDKSKDK